MYRQSTRLGAKGDTVQRVNPNAPVAVKHASLSLPPPVHNTLEPRHTENKAPHLHWWTRRVLLCLYWLQVVVSRHALGSQLLELDILAKLCMSKERCARLLATQNSSKLTHMDLATIVIGKDPSSRGQPVTAANNKQ